MIENLIPVSVWNSNNIGMISKYRIIGLSDEYWYPYNFWYRWDFSDIGMGMDLCESIGIGINLRQGICIWCRYEYDFWVLVSGIGVDSGYKYHYESLSQCRYPYQGISGTLGSEVVEKIPVFVRIMTFPVV